MFWYAMKEDELAVLRTDVIHQRSNAAYYKGHRRRRTDAKVREAAAHSEVAEWM